MTELVVRRLPIDLAAPVPRHWCGGDARHGVAATAATEHISAAFADRLLANPRRRDHAAQVAAVAPRT